MIKCNADLRYYKKEMHCFVSIREKNEPLVRNVQIYLQKQNKQTKKHRQEMKRKTNAEIRDTIKVS